MPTATSARTFRRVMFDTARSTREWTRVPRYYTQRTARQTVTDIRHAHLRDVNDRCRGINPGEQWDARWHHNTPTDAGSPDDCWLEVRYIGPINQGEAGHE